MIIGNIDATLARESSPRCSIVMKIDHVPLNFQNAFGLLTLIVFRLGLIFWIVLGKRDLLRLTRPKYAHVPEVTPTQVALRVIWQEIACNLQILISLIATVPLSPVPIGRLIRFLLHIIRVARSSPGSLMRSHAPEVSGTSLSGSRVPRCFRSILPKRIIIHHPL